MLRALYYILLAFCVACSVGVLAATIQASVSPTDARWEGLCHLALGYGVLVALMTFVRHASGVEDTHVGVRLMMMHPSEPEDPADAWKKGRQE